MTQAFKIGQKEILPKETETLINWWHGLQQDKGTRASLKRCSDTVELLMQPAVAIMCNRLSYRLQDDYNWQARLATVMGLLAYCDPAVEKPPTNLPASMAASRGGRPLVSELRFRRLLQTKPQELYRSMSRLLRMLNGNANAVELIHSAYHWNDRTRQQWAFSYFPALSDKASN